MMSLLPNPHDACFKKLLSDPAIARDFFDIHLPAHLKPYCDLNTLRLESGSFVKDDLRQQFSDILYSLNLAGRTGYLYILIEHLSKAKYLTPFQVLSYQVEAMRQHIHQGHPRLPVVIPLLFYRGEVSPYPEPVDIFECFDQPDLARQVFLSPIHLIDLSVIPDEALRTHRGVALLELLQKHIRQRDLQELARLLVDEILYKALPIESFKSLLYYMFEAGFCADHPALSQFLETKVIDPEYKQAMNTFADYLRQEGRQQGIQQGVQQGIQQGERVVLLRLLKRRFRSLSEAEEQALEQRLMAADAQTLCQWSDNLLDAQTLDQVFSCH